jgi:hypothetical protein
MNKSEQILFSIYFCRNVENSPKLKRNSIHARSSFFLWLFLLGVHSCNMARELKMLTGGTRRSVQDELMIPQGAHRRLNINFC